MGKKTKNTKRAEAVKILDYWAAVEFLSQDSFEISTGRAAYRASLSRYKRLLKKEPEKAARQKSVTAYFEPGSDDDIESLVEKEGRALGMKVHGPYTVYAGTVLREACIKKIAETLGLAASLENRPEENKDVLAASAFQLTEDFMYIKNSFAVSRVLWASNAVSTRHGSPIPPPSTNAFLRAQNALCAVLFKENFPVRAYDVLRKLGEQFPDSGLETYVGVKVVYYRDEEAYAGEPEEEYTGLGRDYFAGDIEWVKGVLETDPGSVPMLNSLEDYITAKAGTAAPWERYDLLNPGGGTDKAEKLGAWLHDILEVRNAPLGKWPSKYNPALMQQVAVNFAVSGGKRGGMMKTPGKIFSVNGPPGTGKTTLLKEIVAGNTVEKARVLAGYTNPDAAFKAHAFTGGAGRKNAYSDFMPYWYSIADERINAYGMLAVSCNNAAVENITKELPMNAGLLSGLSTDPEDRSVQAEGLRKTAALFSPAEEADGADVYFTKYAKQLYGGGAWGLAAAPLGKKTNLSDFWQKTVWGIVRDNRKNSDVEEHKKRFLKAGNEFKAQLKLVESMRDRIARVEDLRRAYIKRKAEHAGKIETLRAETEKLKKEGADYQKDMDALNRKLDAARRIHQTAMAETTALEKTAEKADADYRKAASEATEAYKTVAAVKEPGGLSKMARTKRYREAAERKENLLNFAGGLARRASDLEIKARQARREYEKSAGKLSDAYSAVRKCESAVRTRERSEAVRKNRIETLEREVKEADAAVTAALLEYSAGKRKLQDAPDKTDRVLILDEDFVKDVLSDDGNVSTKAQASNPWFTEHYNREREKLFYLALQVIREFCLGSKAVRTNLNLLGQYWGFSTDENGGRVRFTEGDKKAFAPGLLQTVFLMVPVVSSTFASVGTLFRDAGTPGIIGMLIVDEAGQAQPQTAVGALCRARRAVIVGDPNQVEPVVTDDMDLLKTCYAASVGTAYTADKSASVQAFADEINPIGTYLDGDKWVGCPLTVHRRCISPMFEISNGISYGGIMKQQTVPPGAGKQAKFVYNRSLWIQTEGAEKGNKNHYVGAQGDAVCEILETAFVKADGKAPDIFVISPFTSVVSGIKEAALRHAEENPGSAVRRYEDIRQWLGANVGTVHTFQGKEASEVVFVLGCDRNASGAVRWVNANIVNVAVTRAKYRLYAVGDRNVWKANRYAAVMIKRLGV